MSLHSTPILDARLDKAQIATVYGKVAPVYDIWGKLTESNARRRCLELAAVRDGEAVLEVAVGTGLTFEEIVKANPRGENEAIDLTAAMLRRAQARVERLGGRHVRLALGDAYALQFPDDHFDVLVNNYMFDLLPQTDFARVLSEFWRTLKPGGRLVLVNMTKAARWSEHIAETIYRLRPEWMGGCRGVLLEPYVREAGFSNVHREIISQFTFPSEILRATKGAASSPGPG
jgi:ubiquinone/menaquinone biosynthesis C-methylase UbiE